MPVEKSLEDVQSRIYRIRGQQVMMDKDLAQLYGVRTFRLNEQVKRNRIRFPLDFMFRLSELEWKNLTSQSAISKAGHGGTRRAPYVFTEQGVAMLSSVLHSEKAIRINIAIMRAFVKLRRAIVSSRDIAGRVEKLEGKVNVHETDIRLMREDIQDLKRKAVPPPSFKVTGFE